MQEAPSISRLDNRRAPNASQTVYVELRQRIRDMTMMPGERINEHEIARDRGTSRTPVHEAVQRLAAEGLIEVRRRVGTFVARIPLDTLEDGMLVRKALELVVVERAAERATASGLASLRLILEDQHRCVPDNDVRGFHRTDEAFHEMLAVVAGHRRLWQIVEQAKVQLDRYRRLTLPFPGRMDAVVTEHEAIVAALAAHSPEGAVEAMRRHLDHVLPAIEVVRLLRPDYFISHLDAPEIATSW